MSQASPSPLSPDAYHENDDNADDASCSPTALAANNTPAGASAANTTPMAISTPQHPSPRSRLKVADGEGGGSRNGSASSGRAGRSGFGFHTPRPPLQKANSTSSYSRALLLNEHGLRTSPGNSRVSPFAHSRESPPNINKVSPSNASIASRTSPQPNLPQASALSAASSPTASAAGDHNLITVACRIKPREAGNDRTRCVSVGEDGKTVVWAGDRADGTIARHFTFDYAAGEDIGQEELFEQASS